jgi:magnesium transporter
MGASAEQGQQPTDSTSENLAAEATLRGPQEVVRMLEEVPASTVVEVLQSMNPSAAGDVLEALPPERRNAVLSAASPQQRAQWIRNERYPEDSVGRLMEMPNAVFRADQTIAETVEFVRELAKSTLVTYLFVVEKGRLAGIITMRDLLLAERSLPLRDVMLRDFFFLTPQTPVADAMKEVVRRHFPVYPVCEADGTMVGMVRGQTIFQEQAYEISAQPGRMVGVDKEERLTTPWLRSLKFRHPWLQLNLLTAFIAAAVVGAFQDTIDRIVILAAFLPVLAGQSGNTGCQALAVTLRGMTLGELRAGRERLLVTKEAFLGLLNGALVGVIAAAGMYFAARMQDNPSAGTLALIVFLAMVASCVISGLSGAMIPLVLHRLGADPATASSIFLTTATDVVSMGIFLLLATMLVA